GCSHLLKLVSLDHRGDVNVGHDRLNVQRSLGIGGEDFLDLLGTNGKAGICLGIVQDINLVLLLELGSKVVNEDLVESTASNMPVVSCSHDLEFTLLEIDDRNSVVAVTHVDKCDSPGLLLRRGKVGLGNTIAQSCGGGVID